MKRRIAVLLVLGILPWAGLYAQQQTAQTTFRVSAQVNAVCEVTANNLVFGAYTQTGGALQGNARLQATCSPNTSYQIGLNAGTGGGDITSGRQMASATGQKLNYQLYRESARSTIWGNTPGTDTVTGEGTGVAMDHTVWGTVHAGQKVPAGEYSSTVTVTITY